MSAFAARTSWHRRWGWAGIIAVSWLATDFMMLPESAGAKQLTRQVWNEIFQRSRARETFHPWRIEATIHSDSGGITLDLDLLRYNEPSRIGDAWVRPSRYTSGWWAQVRESYDSTLYVFADVELSEDEQRAIRHQFVEYLHQRKLKEFATWVQEDRGRVVRPLPWGLVRNAVALLAGVVLTISIAAILKMTWVRRTGRRRNARG